MKKYDLIIFDLGRVILDFDHNKSAQKIAKRFDLDKDYIHDLFFESQITKLHDEGKVTPKEFHKSVIKHLNIKLGFKDFQNCWNDIFVLKKDVTGLVKHLRKEYKVYLMSNTNKLHFDFIKKRYSIIKEFHKIILSYKIGVLKPHPKIYRYAFAIAKTTPKKTIYIDDRPELIEGARKLGINGIVFKSSSQLKEELKRFIKI